MLKILNQPPTPVPLDFASPLRALIRFWIPIPTFRPDILNRNIIHQTLAGRWIVLDFPGRTNTTFILAIHDCAFVALMQNFALQIDCINRLRFTFANVFLKVAPASVVRHKAHIDFGQNSVFGWVVDQGVKVDLDLVQVGDCKFQEDGWDDWSFDHFRMKFDFLFEILVFLFEIQVFYWEVGILTFQKSLFCVYV